MTLLIIDESQYKMNRCEREWDLCKEARGKRDNRELEDESNQYSR